MPVSSQRRMCARMARSSSVRACVRAAPPRTHQLCVHQLQHDRRQQAARVCRSQRCCSVWKAQQQRGRHVAVASYRECGKLQECWLQLRPAGLAQVVSHLHACRHTARVARQRVCVPDRSTATQAAINGSCAQALLLTLPRWNAHASGSSTAALPAAAVPWASPAVAAAAAACGSPTLPALPPSLKPAASAGASCGCCCCTAACSWLASGCRLRCRAAAVLLSRGARSWLATLAAPTAAGGLAQLANRLSSGDLCIRWWCSTAAAGSSGSSCPRDASAGTLTC